MKRMLCFAAVLALALFVQQSPAQGQAQRKAGRIVHVPKDFATIQAGLDAADPGDTVFVREGTYRESITLRDDIALIGASAERTIIAGDRKKPAVRGAQGAAIRHFSIENGHAGILCANVVMTIEDCVVRGNRESGIHCLIALPIVRNNIVFRNGASGIFCETTRSHKGYIAHNVIAENTYGGVMLAGQSEVLIENNVFYFNKQYGIFATEGARRSRIAHNSFYGNRHAGNTISQIDKTNIHADPGYTVFSADGCTFWDRTPNMLIGKGRDGADIGLVKRATFIRPSQQARPEYAPSETPVPAAKPVAPASKPESVAPAPVPIMPLPAPLPVVGTDDKKTAAGDAVNTEKTAADSVKTEKAAVDTVNTGKAVTDTVNKK